MKGTNMDISFAIIELGLMILLFIVAKISVKWPSNKWRIIYSAPAFLAVAGLVFIGFNKYHLGIYAAAFLVPICLFIEDRKVRQKQITAMVMAAIIGVNIAVIVFSSGYSRKPYLDDFEKAYAVMKEHYILTDEKGIDWDALYAKYKLLFKEVDRSQDSVENYKVWQQFTGEFYDGHVGYTCKSDREMLEAVCESYGNDYGLSLIRLSTGEYAAVNVEGYDNSYSIQSTDHDELGFFSVKDDYMPDTAEADRLTLKNAGIKNGTIITEWNGRAVEDYFDGINYYIMQYPDRENEEFYLPIYAAGIGQDMKYGDTFIQGEKSYNINGNEITSNPSVDITFINEDGNEETVTAPNLGIYAPRMLDTMGKLDDGVNITNLNWQEVNSDTYMIRISEMIYDQETYDGTDYKEMTDELREKVLALKEAGVKNLIFDLRKNGGGSPYFVEGIACLFAPEGEHLTYYSAVINEGTATFERGTDGRYEMGLASSFTGEDLWHDGQIILLVNAETVSAGDDMTYMMGDFPNVKIIGFTSSNSSCQAVTQVSMEEGDISFSAVPNLLPDGEIAIDTYTDHVGRTPFDEKIPMTQQAISAIFDKGEDYLMNYAADSFN